MEKISNAFSYFLSIIRNITVSDIIDIAIVAFLFYYIYKFIRERRAGKLAIGVVILFLILLLAKLLQMHVMEFLLQNLFQVGMIAIIILFQPELRSALEKVGAEPLKSLRSISESKSGEQVQAKILVEALTEAVCDMSLDKTGALIVLERSTKLGDIIKTGTVINANPTPFLIRNIFFNKAPLHDGAMVIRDNRLYAAGCFLPLSGNTDIIKDLGTRHRAAIGMSENSDAAVIVVSEETGTISIARNGELKRNYSYNSLKTELSELFLDDENAHQTAAQKITAEKNRIFHEASEFPKNGEAPKMFEASDNGGSVKTSESSVTGESSKNTVWKENVPTASDTTARHK